MSDAALKNWFDLAAAEFLADSIQGASAEFDGARFVKLATVDLDALELMGRVRLFSSALSKCLPADIPQALRILVKSLPPPNTGANEVMDAQRYWPFGQFIAEHCVDELDASMDAMVELTQRFTSEFAVRPFLERYPDEVFQRLRKLTAHRSPHVRRWCSEGTRPRLPWGKRLNALVDDPNPILPILEALKDDDELYVRRSVANNLNDIAKDHPRLVVEICERWAKDASPERKKLIAHALRSLVKDGDANALAVVGFGPLQKVSAKCSVTPGRVRVGEFVELRATLTTTSKTSQTLLVDYAVEYVRQHGKTGRKVFKWKQVLLPANGEVELRKKHSMKRTTIRALYPGRHRVEMQVNGTVVAHASFTLL